MPKHNLPAGWRQRLWRVVLVVITGWVGSSVDAAELVTNEALGLRHAPGFLITQFADQDLANDIYAMTLDSQGRVVVTGPGYIKRLEDTDGDGKADRAVLFGTTRTGGMGLCFDGNDLIFFGDGKLSRYRDADGNGIADGEPETLLNSGFGEHGTHAVRKGPDGYWCLIGGNDAGFSSQNATLDGSPILNPEGGCLLRFSPDFTKSEIVAQGFRNPYDFDFNAAGDIFTYDSDCERDFLLPWYVPTRLFHIGVGQHHGWRLTGYQRSWPRRDYYADTVDILAPVGRGSPTGVACYRHTQFPPHYRGGLFALDWTFGKVWFAPLAVRGSSYQSKPELFIEPVGTHGFAPTDTVVAPDGSLFISIGGRKTRGAVYRITALNSGNPAPTAARSQLQEVLEANQPLDAWSRARWLPLAKQLGAEPFLQATADAHLADSSRVRAIEILVEQFDGLPDSVASTLLQQSSASVRARTAWALGVRQYGMNLNSQLCDMATNDRDNVVRRTCLETLRRHCDAIEKAALDQLAQIRDATPYDKRLQQALERLLSESSLPEPDVRQIINGSIGEKLGQATDLVWRHPGISPNTNAITLCLSALGANDNPDVILRAIRIIMLALGDYHLHNPSVEVFTAYEPPVALAYDSPLRKSILQKTRPLFPSNQEPLDTEISRLLAMLQDDAGITPQKLLEKITPTSSATADFHYLVVLARLRGNWDDVIETSVVNALLGLERKLQGQELRTKQVWTTRLAEVASTLLQRHPRLSNKLLAHPELPRPSHLEIAAKLDAADREKAARIFLRAVQSDPTFPWSGQLIDLLAIIPIEDTYPVFRKEWENAGLRDALLAQLSRRPQEIDQERFVEALASFDVNTVRLSAQALAQLPIKLEPRDLSHIIQAMHRLVSYRNPNNPQEAEARKAVLNLLTKQTNESFAIDENEGTNQTLRVIYQPVFTWFAKQYPEENARLEAVAAPDLKKWKNTLASVVWNKGDAVRGKLLFRERACETCHAGSTPIGPNLNGVTARFSINDLFTAIISPSRDVAPAYRSTVFRMRNGETYTGLVSFESADGVILQTGPATTARLADAEILSRMPAEQSLMPDGLLDGCQPQNLADLLAFLKQMDIP